MMGYLPPGSQAEDKPQRNFISIQAQINFMKWTMNKRDEKTEGDQRK